MKVNIRVLGSDSSGNCTLVWDSRTRIMIDCGFSPAYISRNLSELDMDVSSLSGVFITHAHTDHVNGPVIERFVREKVPVFCHRNVQPALIEKQRAVKQAEDVGLLKIFGHKPFESGSFTIQSFEVPHDSPGGCFGFNIFKKLESGVKKITIATDLGYSDDGLIENFIDSDVIIIESNHDLSMLENSDRPLWVKQRIREVGHLSNEQCAVFLKKVISKSRKKPQAVILAHISRQCNTSCLAKERTRDILDKHDCSAVEVFLTHRMKANETLTID